MKVKAGRCWGPVWGDSFSFSFLHRHWQLAPVWTGSVIQSWDRTGSQEFSAAYVFVVGTHILWHQSNQVTAESWGTCISPLYSKSKSTQKSYSWTRHLQIRPQCSQSRKNKGTAWNKTILEGKRTIKITRRISTFSLGLVLQRQAWNMTTRC